MKYLEHDYLFKILMIGDSGVGKTCVLSMFMNDNFTDSFISTIGVDFKMQTIKIDNKIIKLQIWDTAGQERFKAITSSYYRGSHGVIVMFDVCNRVSFQNINKWLEEINRYADPCINILLVGNKIDNKEKRVISYQEAKDFADLHNLIYLETSAKNGDNIQRSFILMAHEIKKRINKTFSSTSNLTNINLKNSQPVVNSQSTTSCCNF